MKERGNHFLKFLDRYLGIPLIFFLRPFKTRKVCQKNFKKIALLKTAGIGDIVLLSAVIRDLKITFPEKEITLFTGYSNYEAALLISSIEVIPLPMTNPLSSLRRLRNFSFDILIDCDPWPRINALLAFFSKTTYTIGFQTKNQFRHYLFDKCVVHSQIKHEIENYRILLKPLGIRSDQLPFFDLPPKEVVKSKVALHLFAGGLLAEVREWPNKNWHALIEQLLKWECQIVLTGSQKDFEKLKEFSKYPSLQILAGCSLRETAEHLKSCSLVVSVNTGIMHLAAALGCTVVCLHGPSTPKRWGAKGVGVINITPKNGYKPTLHLGFEAKAKKNRDMEKITVDQVLEVLNKFLAVNRGV